MSKGELHLAIRHNGNMLVATKKTGGFGGSRWIRVGYQLTSTVSGRVTGEKRFAKRVSIYGPNNLTKFHSSTAIDANGHYRFVKLPVGKYRVVPVPGGKFSLRSVPRSREIVSTGDDIRNVNFEIKGIEEG